MLEIEESRSSRRTLELLTDDYFDRVFDLVRHQPSSLLNGLVDLFELAGGAAGGYTRLVALIEEYGEAMKYHLQLELGLDLLAFSPAPGGPRTQLVRLGERLPDHGHCEVAIRDDDERARCQRDVELADG